MKRYGNIYDKICDIENIKLAHKNARKKKTHYKEVKEVDKVVIHSKYSLIRKKIKYNCIFKIKNGCSRGVIASYNGWLLMCDSYNLRKKYNI